MTARLVQVLFRFCGTNDSTLTSEIVANQADTAVQQGPLRGSNMWESTRWLVSGAFSPSPPQCGHGLRSHRCTPQNHRMRTPACTFICV